MLPGLHSTCQCCPNVADRPEAEAAALHPDMRRANAEDYSLGTCTQLCKGEQHNGYKVLCPH